MTSLPHTMRFNFIRPRSAFLVFLLLWIFSGKSHAQNKPILMMGPTYSRFEREALCRDVLEPNDLTFEDGGDFTSAELWKNYSLVIVTHGFPALDERELGWMRDYLNSGGRLLLTGPVLSSLTALREEKRDWLGAMGYTVVKEGDFTLTEPGRSLVPDAATARKTFGRVPNFGLVKLTTAEPLVLREGAALLARNPYGKGEVWFLGMEYFRVLATERTADAKLAAGAPARELFSRLILRGHPQRKSERIATGLRQFTPSTLVWRRDFSEARGAAFQDIPYPVQGEELREIQLDLVQGEAESVPLYISSRSAEPNFQVTLTDLTTIGGINPNAAKIPAARIQVRAQGIPDPKLTVGPYWLLDLPQKTGGATYPLPLKANDSTTLWLTLAPMEYAPGEYRGEIRFNQNALPPVTLKVRVWPIKLPDRQYFESEATFAWNSLLPESGGKPFNFPNPPGDMTPFRRHIENLASHRISFNVDVSWGGRYGRSLSLHNVRLLKSGVPFEAAIQQGLIQPNNLPALDFSYFDPFVETPLLAGMPYFHFNFKNLPGDWLGYARDICRDPQLPADSPSHIAIKRWLYGECLRYLKGKGITKIVSFVADEIGPEEIPDVVRRAAMMKSLGARVAFTATGHTGQSREHIAALNPAIDRWIWNTVILPQAKALQTHESPVDAGDEQYNYVADWHRAPYVFNRTRGIFCAYHQLDGLFIHGYLRWYPNGGAVYSTPSGPVDTEGWEGARDGIEDARLWKKARMLLQAAKARPDLAVQAGKIEQDMSQWVAQSPKAFVELQPTAYSIYNFQNPASSYERLQNLKRNLLEALLWLERNVPTTDSLTYADIDLVTNGKPIAHIVGNAQAAATLNQKLAARALPPLPYSKELVPGNAIVLGTKAELTKLLPGQGIEAATPGVGSYQFLVQKGRVIIVGGDSEGLAKGTAVLMTVAEHLESAG